MLTQIWFVVNCFFVALTVTFLFMNRSLQEALRSGDRARVRSRRLWRAATGVLAVVFFAAMAVLFLVNMRVNG